MGYTNTTAHYNLPQYVSTDVPSILGDVNSAYSAIDSAIYAAAEDATDAKSDAASAVSAVASAQADATLALTNAATAQTTADGAVTAVGMAQSTANTAVANAATAQSTADGAVTAAGTAQADATSALGKANALETLVGNTTLPTTAQTVTGAISELNGEVNKGSVNVTPETNETFGAVMSRLHSLVDFSKVNEHTVLVEYGTNFVSFYQCQYADDTKANFIRTTTSATEAYFIQFIVDSTGAKYVGQLTSNGFSSSDGSSTLATGTKYEIRY